MLNHLAGHALLVWFYWNPIWSCLVFWFGIEGPVGDLSHGMLKSCKEIIFALNQEFTWPNGPICLSGISHDRPVSSPKTVHFRPGFVLWYCETGKQLHNTIFRVCFHLFIFMGTKKTSITKNIMILFTVINSLWFIKIPPNRLNDT